MMIITRGRKAKRNKRLPVRNYGKRRRCLMCLEFFNSYHAGQRICHPCKDSDVWKAGENDQTLSTNVQT